jgi:hypothetical protein
LQWRCQAGSGREGRPAAAGLQVVDLAAEAQDFFVFFEQPGKKAGIEGEGERAASTSGNKTFAFPNPFQRRRWC